MPGRRYRALGDAIPTGQERGEDECGLGLLGPGGEFTVHRLGRVGLAQFREQRREGSEEVLLVLGIRFDQGGRLGPLTFGREQAGPQLDRLGGLGLQFLQAGEPGPRLVGLAVGQQASREGGEMEGFSGSEARAPSSIPRALGQLFVAS